MKSMSLIYRVILKWWMVWFLGSSFDLCRLQVVCEEEGASGKKKTLLPRGEVEFVRE